MHLHAAKKITQNKKEAPKPQKSISKLEELISMLLLSSEGKETKFISSSGGEFSSAKKNINLI